MTDSAEMKDRQQGIDDIFRLMSATILDAFLLMEPDGTVRTANDEACRLFGMTEEEICRGGLGGLNDPDDHRLALYLGELARTGKARGELSLRRKDGAPFPAELSSATFTGDTGRVVVCSVIRDLTAHKRTEEELKTSLARRTRELESVNRELEAFSYTVSHDLRSPLTQITGYTQLLQEVHGKRLDDQGRDFLQQIATAGQRMARLIEALLKFSRVSRRDLEKVRIDLGAIVAEIAGELQQVEPQRRVRFLAPSVANACGDPILVRIMLVNLLDNAWKFTANRDTPVIEFGSTECNGTTVFFMRDNGIGFSREEGKRLFTPFHRVRREEGNEGTGIGLATVQRIVHRHGGEVWAESEEGKGATFFFTLGALHREAPPAERTVSLPLAGEGESVAEGGGTEE